jgi:hypothetical protein
MFRSKYWNRHVKDDRRPKKKKLMRPTFSNKRGCWIMDYVFKLTTHESGCWLFFVNMNCRYLIAYKVSNKSTAVAYEAFKAFGKCLRKELNVPPIKEDGTRFDNLLCDGEKSFNSNDFAEIRDKLKITFYSNNSAYTYHNKILDRCVRTIRDMLGYQKPIRISDVFQAIHEYNHTRHKGIDCTPYEMLMNPDLEWQYIRYCKDKLRQIYLNQEQQSLWDYEKGNILFLHLEFSKTNEKFEKQRRFWNRIGEFKKYVHGNVRVKLIEKRNRTKIVVPIYYTKFLADDYESIPYNVREDYSKFL